MNVKQLIDLLEQLDNKFFEVEVYISKAVVGQIEIRHVLLPNSQRKKVLICVKD